MGIKYHELDITIGMYYQRAAIWSIYSYRMILNHLNSDCLSFFKVEWSLLIKKLSITVTLKSLLLLVNLEKLSKPDV